VTSIAVLSYFGARILIEQTDVSTAWRVALALSPVPLFGWVTFEIVRAARQLDEMQRRIHLEALAIAYPVVIILIMTLGLVELAVPLDEDNWSYRHVWQMQGLVYLLSLLIAQRRYGVTAQ
jgi:hypothetical protein